MNLKEMDVKTFLDMFMAVSYSQGQSLFDYTILEEFLFCDEEYSETEQDEIDGKIINYLGEYERNGLVERLNPKKFIYRILNTYNFRKVIEDNYDYLEDMRTFFFDFVADKPLNHRITLKSGMKK